MNVNITVCCDRCGRDLFRMPTVKELREKQTIYFPEHYIINDNGRPENLCISCFEAMIIKKSKEA